MKITINFFLIFIFSTNIIYAQEWIKTDITEFASIKFPVESELIETHRETVFTAEDEFGYYIVSIRKLTDQQSSQIKKKDIPTLYQGVAQGAMDAANAEIVSMNDIFIQKMPALEIEFYAPANPALPSQRFTRIIYLNQTIVIMDFWPITNQEDLVNDKKIKYFNSFSINSVEDIETPTIPHNEINNSNSSYEKGFIIGQMLFYVILIAFLIGIILLIKHLITKNRKNKRQVQNKEQPQMQLTKIICQNCNSENKSNSKYCMSCGYELTKI